MTHAFGLGIEHALYALAWTSGVLLVAVAVALVILLPVALFRDQWHHVTLWYTIRRLRREARASGRS